MKIAFDMSSVMWTCLRAGKDAEALEVTDESGKKQWVNSAAHGYEAAVNLMKLAMDEAQLAPIDCLLVFEGRDSKKRRTMIDPTYKAGSGRQKLPQEYEQFNLLKQMLLDTFLNLGSVALSQPFVEGDDVLGWLAANMEEDLMIVTNDGDITVLNGMNEYGFQVMVRLNKDLAGGKFAYLDDKRCVHLYKTLVGDSSDNIKGCPGFGEVAWKDLLVRYDEDGAVELLQLIGAGKKNEIAAIAVENNCKLLNRIVDQWDATVKSYKLSKIYPEWVNTLKQPLDWQAGMTARKTNDERLKKWRATRRLVGSKNYAEAIDFLKQQLPNSGDIAFDIETSTPEESDDWLAAQGNPNGVDVFGSYLVGFSLTFGSNNQYTYYVSVKHFDSDNITMVQAREMLELTFEHKKAIQNTSFELSVLYEAKDEDGTLWRDHWKDAGEFGMLPNIYDTLFEASYVDENSKLGLKERSLQHLNYVQPTFADTTCLEGKPYPGGTWIEKLGKTQYKMHELPATHVFDYGCDDTVCTAALHNFYRTHMKCDHHWNVYVQVELNAAYLHAKAFCDGVDVSASRLKELEREDKETYDKAWAILRQYLMDNGWDGTVPPTYTADITPKEMKEAYGIVMGLDTDEPEEDEDSDEQEVVPAVKDEFLSSRVRTPAKLVTLLQSLGHDDFAAMLQGCLDGKAEEFTAYVRRHFSGEPKFKASNKQMTKLLYEVMKLPVHVRGKVTETMKKKGITQGNPKGDTLAISYAKMDATPELNQVLDAIKLMQMVRTRESLFYKKYPGFIHWRDGKIHSSHRQCSTNTRRASSSSPNLQQLPKAAKIEGYEAKFRQVIIPHTQNAVIVSMDFAAQELRIIADYSQDRNMLACFIGNNRKDMHALTGLGIMQRRDRAGNWSYETFMEALKDEHNEKHKEVKKTRQLGKLVNFTSEFGAAAPKLASVLMVSEEDGQAYLDAKEAAFPDAVAWKARVIDEAKSKGFVTTMCGARRHLATLLNSEDRFIASKAERQAVNFKVQGSAAEMTKLAEGRMWRLNLLNRYDCQYVSPIHDEAVFSVAIKDLFDFLTEAHGCMTAQYSGMVVPVESSISFGSSLGAQIEIGDKVTDEAVNKGLKEMLETA